MPITAQIAPGVADAVSISTPAILSRPSSTSLGHFRRASTSKRASVSAITVPTASGRPTKACGGNSNFQASENVSVAPGSECQLRPARPRPAVWFSATSKVGSRKVPVAASKSALVDPVSATTLMATRRAWALRSAAIFSAENEEDMGSIVTALPARERIAG